MTLRRGLKVKHTSGVWAVLLHRMNRCGDWAARGIVSGQLVWWHEDDLTVRGR